MPQAGFDFAPITIKGFQRRLTWFNVKYNISSVFYLTTASARSKRLIQKFGPDLVVGTGGYVSGPILRKAAQLGIKTVSHESNAFPGVTTKLLSRYVDEILLAVPEAKKYLHPNCKEVVVGNPVRESIVYADREKARKKLGVADKLCIVSFGGSQGAHRLNQAMADLIAWHTKPGNPFTGKIHQIHATGKYGVEDFPRCSGSAGPTFRTIPTSIYGNTSTTWTTAWRRRTWLSAGPAHPPFRSWRRPAGASILIPSPNVAENHQYHNGMVLVKNEAALLIEEKDLTGEKLCGAVEELARDPQRLRRLGQNAQKLAMIDANERIYEELMRLLRSAK